MKVHSVVGALTYYERNTNNVQRTSLSAPGLWAIKSLSILVTQFPPNVQNNLITRKHVTILHSYLSFQYSGLTNWQSWNSEFSDSEAFGRQIHAGYAQKDQCGHQPSEADVTCLGSQGQATWLFCVGVSPVCHWGSLWSLVKVVFLSRTGWEVTPGPGAVSPLVGQPPWERNPYVCQGGKWPLL